MKCMKCGQEIADDSVFCPKCGEKVETSEQPLEETGTEKNTTSADKADSSKETVKFSKNDIRKIFIIALAVIAAIILIKGVLGQIGNGKTTNDNNSFSSTSTNIASTINNSNTETASSNSETSFDELLSNSEAITPGTKITLDGYGELVFKKACSTNSIFGSLGSSLYYENKNSGEVYADFVFTAINQTSTNINLDEFMSVRARNSSGVEYNNPSFFMDDDGGTNISAYGNLEPLKNNLIHCTLSVPDDGSDLVTVFTINDHNYVFNYKEGTTVSDATFISKDETITVDDVAEITFKGVTYTDDLKPSKTNGYYTHYEVDDSSNTYLVVQMNVKNLQSSAKDCDEFVGASLVYQEKYNYNGFVVCEDDDKEGFSAYKDIKPLAVGNLYYLFEVPDSLKGEEALLTLTVAGNEYTYKFK